MNKAKTAGPVKLVGILLIISIIVSLILGFVNHITKDQIAYYNEEKTSQAMSAVLPAEYYETAKHFEPTGLVTNLYRAFTDNEQQGWIAQVSPSGFGGTIDMMVGTDNLGTITGISIISMSETSGLGANAKKESFRSQFIGKSGTLALTKKGGEIDALTGATVTSTAVTNGVNAALEAIGEYIKEDIPAEEDIPEPTPDAVSSATD